MRVEEREKWRWSIKGVEGDIRERESDCTARDNDQEKKKNEDMDRGNVRFCICAKAEQGQDTVC